MSAREYAADLFPPRARPTARRRPGPHGTLAILGISVLALLGGGLLGSIIRVDLGWAGADALNVPRPTPAIAPEPTAPADPGEAEEDPDPAGPRVFSDGFTLGIQACDAEPTGPDCGSSGALNDGTVWVLLSFEDGEAEDMLGVTVLAGGDDPVGGGEVVLGDIGCEDPCEGWTYFSLEDLEPGPYRVNVSRNEEPAGTTAFVVTEP